MYVDGRLQGPSLNPPSLSPPFPFAAAAMCKQGPWRVRRDHIGCGLMDITARGPVDGSPCKVGVAMTNLQTGLHAYGSILAALLARHRTGHGARIECSLLETQVASLANVVSACEVSIPTHPPRHFPCRFPPHVLHSIRPVGSRCRCAASGFWSMSVSAPSVLCVCPD